ncbi:MAG TPA: leucyl aminopeptidase family protein [Rhodospirillales bacterium]|nr:leucyl aminopeptidase family protein [Rhodospirillales bacterium]
MSACRYLTETAAGGAIPVTPLKAGELTAFLERAPADAPWVRTLGFGAAPGSHCLLPAADGGLARVLLGIGDNPMWDWASLPAALPAATYRIDAPLSADEAEAAALGWALATYRFDRYRKPSGVFAALAWPDAADRAAVERAADATFLVRDLITTPAADMGPAELAHAVAAVAQRFGARFTVIEGDELLVRGYPSVHAVGRASDRAPRLIDLLWGDEAAPKVTLCGKGVCFDSGGLDIKSAAGMKLMKKDMGGAAILLGLTQMIIDAGLPVRLRLLIPAVENSISGNALRPLDVIRTRKGLSVEIGNTDAEGRVILADTLAEAASERPAVLIDCATLTGAARVALGTELPALFSNDDALADGLLAAGRRVADPLWRLPLWQPYRRHVNGKTADLTNAPDHAFAGAITAALFLAEFVEPACPWAHLDTMAWNLDNRPGRPEGGEAMGMRALFAALAARFAG